MSLNYDMFNICIILERKVKFYYGNEIRASVNRIFLFIRQLVVSKFLLYASRKFEHSSPLSVCGLIYMLAIISVKLGECHMETYCRSCF